ncbi:MAG TPA: GNAT family N-acetyltransferase [Chthoniobacterales bacterium]|nr:GNAT family N-acetyltransferase [Chthoniobacterales bacterium]
MSKIEVSQVRSRRERDAFIKFPWRIYRNDPAWVPPLIIERKAFLDRKKHPFYQHGEAALFLARRDGEVVGRIIASDDSNYNSLHQTSVGCFGLFDCINDREVSTALFEAAGDWLRARGRTEVMGPIDYSTNYVCGLLIAGFEHPPMLLTAHNPPYYADLIETAGFSKVKDWYAWWFDDFPEPAQRLRKIAAGRAGKRSVSIRPINLRDLKGEAVRIRTVYNKAWQKNWGFVPFTEAEAEHLTKEMKPLLVREGVLIAEVGDEPVGFVIGVPDINAALRHIDGRLTRFGIPIGLIKLIYYKGKVRTGRLIALGVVEEYRRAGVAELLILQFMEEAYRRGFSGELSMTLEDNVLVNRFIEAMGAKRYKTYRIYARSLG